MSILAGSFTAFLILSVSGIIREFSIKSPLFAMSSRLEERIRNVQSEVSESKKDISEKISGLYQAIYNVQSIVSTNTFSSRTNQSTSVSVTPIINALETQKKEIISNQNIRDEISPSGKLPQGVRNNILELDEVQKKVEEIGKSLDKLLYRDIQKEVQEANLYFYAGNYTKALHLYDDILKDYPNNIDILINKGMVLYRLSKYRDSLSLFEKALQINPKNFIACIYQAFVHSRLGEEEKAKPLYKRATELPIDENDIEDLVNKGIAFYKVGDAEKGNDFFDKADKIEIVPNNVEALINIGFARLYQRKYEEAITMFERALKIDPENPFALYDAASVYALQGKNIDRVFDLLEKDVELYPADKEIIRKDSDFDGIRNDERYKRIIAE